MFLASLIKLCCISIILKTRSLQEGCMHSSQGILPYGRLLSGVLELWPAAP